MRVYSRGHPLTPPSVGQGLRKKQEARRLVAWRSKNSGLVAWWTWTGGLYLVDLLNLTWKEARRTWTWPGDPTGWRPGLFLESGRQEVPRMQDGLEIPLDGGHYFNIDFGAEKLSVYSPVFFKTIDYVNKSDKP